MKFSVVIPTLNAISSLPAAVASVRHQTHADWELHVQDGNSTDGTRDWLRGQANLTWSSAHDGGMYDAINRGWQSTNGDILSWLNADEQYLPDTLATVDAVFRRRPDVDLVFGDYILTAPNGDLLAVRREIPLRAWYALHGTLYAHSCTLFVRRALLDRAGPFDPAYRIRGDKEWILRLLRAGVRPLHLRAFLGLFVVTGHNLSLDRQAEAESVRIRAHYGAYRSPLLRAFVRACRHVEKAARGCYGRHRVDYPFARPDGTVRRVQGIAGSRWQWSPESNHEPHVTPT